MFGRKKRENWKADVQRTHFTFGKHWQRIYPTTSPRNSASHCALLRSLRNIMPHWKHVTFLAGFFLVAAVTLLWSNTDNDSTENSFAQLQFRGRRRLSTKKSSTADSPSGLNHGNLSQGGLITNFWLEKNRPHAPNLPPDLKRARDALREAVTALQHPDDCSTAKICTCGYPMKGGLFSMLHGRGLCLLTALANNCTLVDAPGVEDKIVHKHAYIDQNECALNTVDSPFECYFQPLSTCAFDKARRVRLYSRDSCDRFDELFNQVSQRFGISSKLLLQTEMMSYIMRPNQRLHNSILEHGERMQLSSRANLSQCLAVHIRHTDKHGVPASEKLHTQFVGAADDLRKLYGFDVINYMTDDPAVDTLFEVRLTGSCRHHQINDVPSSYIFLLIRAYTLLGRCVLPRSPPCRVHPSKSINAR